MRGAGQEIGGGVDERADQGQESTGRDPGGKGAGHEDEEVEAGQGIEGEVAPSPDLDQGTGVKKTGPALTRPTQSNRK